MSLSGCCYQRYMVLGLLGFFGFFSLLFKFLYQLDFVYALFSKVSTF
jgi:hypothetical protein